MQNTKLIFCVQNTKPKPSIKLIKFNYNIKQTTPFFSDSKWTQV
jgi:hypothetical protein